MTDICDICCEKFTSHKRSKIECAECHFEACQVCYRQFLTSTISEPACMNCKKEFSTNFLYENMTNNWLNGIYKEHRIKVLIEKEKALIPQTQESLVGWRRVKQMRQENVDREKRIGELVAELSSLRHKIYTVEREAVALSANRYMGRAADDEEEASGSSSSSSSSKWTMQCPFDGCDGFLDRTYVCGTCEKKTCSKCHHIVEQLPHTCDEASVASVAAIKKDSKHCPNSSCGAWIHKISGCSQMFCTSCKTIFDWNTLEIQTGGILHNPHWHEWVRNQNGGIVPRQPGDVPVCEQLPSFEELDLGMRMRGLIVRGGANRVRNVPFAPCQEIAAIEMNSSQERITECCKYRNLLVNMLGRARYARYTTLHMLAPPADQDPNWDLRFGLLTKKYSQEEYGRLLSVRDRRLQRERELYLIVEAFCLASADLFNQFIYGEDGFDGDLAAKAQNMESCPLPDEAFAFAETVTTQLSQVAVYSHHQCAKVCRRYGTTNRYIYQDY